jgi:hypothetical protein
MTRQEYKDIYDIVGVAQEVHKTLGRGPNATYICQKQTNLCY